jgi:hypothetical protein
MNTIMIAAILAFSATAANAQTYYNNDYNRSMNSTEYQIYDRTQRGYEQAEMNRRHEEQMDQQRLQQQSMDRSRRSMEFDAMQLNSRLR